MLRTPCIAVILLASIAFAGELFQGVPAERVDAPRSRDAIDALAKLEGAKRRAKAAYDAELKRATDEAVKSLEDVKKNVMKSGGDGALDEANRIDKIVEAMKEKKIRIVSATWGADQNRQIDVTKKIASAVALKRNFIANFESLGDPAKWRIKTLLIVADIGGNEQTITVNEGDSLPLILIPND